MKNSKKIGLIILSIVAIALCISCDNVYYSAVSGNVHDSSGTGIKGVKVYAYTSEAERDRVYNSFEYGKDFDDPNCLFRATTAANGDFSIPRVVWKTSSSEWGTDFAQTSLYFIFFSKDYGIQKEDGVHIISGSSNASSVSVDMGNTLRTNCKFTLRFKDWSDLTQKSTRDSVTSPITFTYSYNDGYGIVTDSATATGAYEFSIPAIKGEDGTIKTELTISNIKQADGYWVARNSEKKKDVDAVYKFEITSTDSTGDVMLRREKWNLGKGLSGTVTTTTTVEESKNFFLDGATVSGTLNNVPHQVTVVSTDTPATDKGITIKGSFSGLFANEEVPITYEEEGTANEKPKQLEATEIKLDVHSATVTQAEAAKYIIKTNKGSFDPLNFDVTDKGITCKSPSLGK